MQHCNESDWDNEEQQQEECILSYFFFKNWAAPSEEYKRFVAFNNKGDRPYASLTSEQKESIAVLWQQKPQKAPRFKPQVLEFFGLMYTAACSSHQKHESRMMFLQDNLSVNIKDDALYIVCPKPLYLHIENQLEIYKPIIRDFGKTMKIKDFKYTLV